nr:MAG TPA: hypothetical protein [Caudoviricetes sp.]
MYWLYNYSLIGVILYVVFEYPYVGSAVRDDLGDFCVKICYR